MDPEPARPQLQFRLPDELRKGVYSNLVSVWHGADDFTLDFAVLDMPEQAADGRVVMGADVVARIKVPTSVIFKIARAIADNVDRYERTYGPITPRPGDDDLHRPPGA